jgi:hypothetical protein
MVLQLAVGSWQLRELTRVLHGRLWKEDLSVEGWGISTAQLAGKGLTGDVVMWWCGDLVIWWFGDLVICKVWRSAVALWLLVVPIGVYKWCQSNIQCGYSHTPKSCQYINSGTCWMLPSFCKRILGPRSLGCLCAFTSTTQHRECSIIRHVSDKLVRFAVSHLSLC